MFPECLERMVALAEEHPSVGIVGAYGLEGSKIIWTGLRYPSAVISGREICRRLFLEGLYVFGSATAVLYRSDLVRIRDPFYNESNLHSDMETCITLLAGCDFGFVHQVLTYTREERPGTLRKISESLNTYAAAKLHSLVTYGRDFLSEEEFQVCLRKSLTNYYGILAGGIVRIRDRRFWDYHKKKLDEAGFAFSRARLASVVLSKLCNAVLNPKATLEKGWQIMREISARRRPRGLPDSRIPTST
jgi:hypothetical protein